MCENQSSFLIVVCHILGDRVFYYTLSSSTSLAGKQLQCSLCLHHFRAWNYRCVLYFLGLYTGNRNPNLSLNAFMTSTSLTKLSFHHFSCFEQYTSFWLENISNILEVSLGYVYKFLKLPLHRTPWFYISKVIYLVHLNIKLLVYFMIFQVHSNFLCFVELD